ncbi:MAG TPA: GNAT family N-acetyltransferase [Rhizobiaceae bacterium]|nr:GNAT family N-acetyltransferase [Rhizobiaceae bacterium]
MQQIEIRPLEASGDTVGQLAQIIVEVVAGGGSVSFMHPLAFDKACRFWETSLAAAARGERVVLGAWDGAILAGTVTLLLDFPVNQPHRAEIAKMMTRIGHRGRGIAMRLMQRAEAVAVERGKTLLVLDTATRDGAAGLYEKLGFTLTGEVPDYALTPDGTLSGTLIYWKRIGEAAAA